MERKTQAFRPLLFCVLMLTCSTTFAAINAMPYLGEIDFIGAGSFSNVNTDNSYLGVTSSETDKLVQTNNDDWNSWGGQLGE